MARIVKRSVYTHDPEVAAKWAAKGCEITTEPPELVGGPFHILTGANLVKRKPRPKKRRSR